MIKVVLFAEVVCQVNRMGHFFTIYLINHFYTCSISDPQAATIFLSRGSPMGQPDQVNLLPDSAQLLNPKFDVVENMLVEPYNVLSLGKNACK